MKYFRKLVGEHIYLSPIRVEDVEKYTEWMNDFETTDYTGRSSQIYTVENERKWLEGSIEDKSNQIFGIVDLENDKLIGNCGIHKIDSKNRTATLGIFIGDKEERNKGYGTETIKLRESEYVNGKYYDRISMDILKSEFKESYIKNKNI